MASFRPSTTWQTIKRVWFISSHKESKRRRVPRLPPTTDKLARSKSCRQRWTLSQIMSKWWAEKRNKTHTLLCLKSLKFGHEMRGRVDCCRGLWQWVHTFCTDVGLQKYKNVNCDYALMQFNIFSWESQSVSLWFLIQCNKCITKNECYKISGPSSKWAVLKIKIIKRPLTKSVACVGITWAGVRVVCVKKRFLVGLSQCWPAWPVRQLSGWWTEWTLVGSAPVLLASSPAESDTTAVKQKDRKREWRCGCSQILHYIWSFSIFLREVSVCTN